MKNIYTITEQEKNRILGMHQNATKKQYLMEQELTGASDRKSQNSSTVFSKLKSFCTDNKNKLDYTGLTEERKAFLEKMADQLVYNTSQGFFRPNEENKKKYKDYIKYNLSEPKTGGELCYMEDYIIKKKGFGIHGALSSNNTIPFDFKMALDAMTPAFTDADNKIKNYKAPPSQSWEKYYAQKFGPEVAKQLGYIPAPAPAPAPAPNNKPVEEIAASLINLIRTNVGSKPGTGPTLNNDDLNKIIEKLGAI